MNATASNTFCTLDQISTEGQSFKAVIESMIVRCIGIASVSANDLKGGSCRAAAWFWPRTLVIAGSTYQGFHAEEALAIGCWKIFGVDEFHAVRMYVDIIPCDGKRYGPHKCRPLLGDTGTALKYKGQDTPVLRIRSDRLYYGTELPPKGESALKNVHTGNRESDLSLTARAMNCASGLSLENSVRLFEHGFEKHQYWEKIYVCKGSSDGVEVNPLV